MNNQQQTNNNHKINQFMVIIWLSDRIYIKFDNIYYQFHYQMVEILDGMDLIFHSI